MSSILEALRELDRRHPPTAPIPVAAEQPAVRSRSLETLGIVGLGLVLGALGFVIVIGMSGLLGPTVPAERDAPRTRPVEDSSAARPAWLEGADPPRARVGTQGPASSDGSPHAADRPKGQDGVELAGIEYSPDAARRAVRLRLEGGTQVRLREHESVRGVEVQSIQPDGVYLRRGGEVFLLGGH